MGLRPKAKKDLEHQKGKEADRLKGSKPDKNFEARSEAPQGVAQPVEFQPSDSRKGDSSDYTTKDNVTHNVYDDVWDDVADSAATYGQSNGAFGSDIWDEDACPTSKATESSNDSRVQNGSGKNYYRPSSSNSNQGCRPRYGNKDEGRSKSWENHQGRPHNYNRTRTFYQTRQHKSNSESWDGEDRAVNRRYRKNVELVDAPQPEVNIWEERKAKQEFIKTIIPHSEKEEEAMLKQALEMSRRQAMEDEKLREAYRAYGDIPDVDDAALSNVSSRDHHGNNDHAKNLNSQVKTWSDHKDGNGISDVGYHGTDNAYHPRSSHSQTVPIVNDNWSDCDENSGFPNAVNSGTNSNYLPNNSRSQTVGIRNNTWSDCDNDVIGSSNNNNRRDKLEKKMQHTSICDQSKYSGAYDNDVWDDISQAEEQNVDVISDDVKPYQESNHNELENDQKYDYDEDQADLPCEVTSEYGVSDNYGINEAVEESDEVVSNVQRITHKRQEKQTIVDIIMNAGQSEDEADISKESSRKFHQSISDDREEAIPKHERLTAGNDITASEVSKDYAVPKLCEKAYVKSFEKMNLQDAQSVKSKSTTSVSEKKLDGPSISPENVKTSMSEKDILTLPCAKDSMTNVKDWLASSNQQVVYLKENSSPEPSTELKSQFSSQELIVDKSVIPDASMLGKELSASNDSAPSMHPQMFGAESQNVQVQNTNLNLVMNSDHVSDASSFVSSQLYGYPSQPYPTQLAANPLAMQQQQMLFYSHPFFMQQLHMLNAYYTNLGFVPPPQMSGYMGMMPVNPLVQAQQYVMPTSSFLNVGGIQSASPNTGLTDAFEIPPPVAANETGSQVSAGSVASCSSRPPGLGEFFVNNNGDFGSDNQQGVRFMSDPASDDLIIPPPVPCVTRRAYANSSSNETIRKPKHKSSDFYNSKRS